MRKIDWSLLFQCTWLCSIGAMMAIACTRIDDTKAKANRADEYCRLYYLHLREVSGTLSSAEEPLLTAVAERFVRTSEDRLRFDSIMDCSHYRLNIQDMRVCSYRKDYACMTKHLAKVSDSFYTKANHADH